MVEANRAVWAAMAAHPFVLGLADGSLPEPALEAWVQQDRVFVLQERRVLAALRAHGLPAGLDRLLAGLHDGLVAEAAGGPAASAYRDWIENWTGDAFRAFVAGLGEELDELAGTPAPAMAERLAAVFARAARFELAFWEMCWSGQGWPG